MKRFGQRDYPERLKAYKATVGTWITRANEARELAKIPVHLPGGELVGLSPGGQNVLIKAMVEEFCPRLVPGGSVLFIGDTSRQGESIDQQALDDIGVQPLPRGKEPDLIVWMKNSSKLFLMEAASTHGPVDVTRKAELIELFEVPGVELVFVSCFPNRKVMQSFLPNLAWETHAWCADTPDHLIHFDGANYLAANETSSGIGQ